MRHIVIAGTIGVGKTTAARALATALDMSLREELPDRNPFIARYYANSRSWALRSQLWFLLDAIERHRRGGVQDHSYYEAAHVFAHVQHTRGELTTEDFELLQSAAAMADRLLPVPDAVVLLTAPLAKLAERIAARRRPYERDLPESLLSELDERRRRYFGRWVRSPIVEIDTGTWDPRRADDLDILVRRLMSTIPAGV
ncbi:MAG TPA: deoxynucleoside kinase [Baekduia sp.]|nr:deoxynucleoside kinase [Baekduia sp.]